MSMEDRGLCDRVTGCTPQAFLSLASLDGPVDNIDGHEDGGPPCLNKASSHPPLFGHPHLVRFLPCGSLHSALPPCRIFSS